MEERNIKTQAKIKLYKQLRHLQNDPHNGCGASLADEDSLYEWDGYICGPSDTPYEGGVFMLRMSFPEDYPFRPMVVKFKTKIYHPNIRSDGLVGMNILADEWTPALTADKVLLSICSLLGDPNPMLCFNPEIGKEYLKDREAYDRKAREWTDLYA
ncbi:unnamed protein product [Moneuplotes crassus]|uniref:E2 ubiquitin-conjugating enzyme n=1 Tax=Euplotes crassus TaxID=5936 RepID=A0AAD1Y3X4_EUPCR|nr:unnamed protein product [Moneuplotes crassus]